MRLGVILWIVVAVVGAFSVVNWQVLINRAG